MKKRMQSTPEPTKRPTTVAELDGMVCPPHCVARRRQKIDPVAKTVPTISNFLSMAGTDRAGAVLLGCEGNFKKT